MSRGSVIFIVIMVLYILSPIDLIPDMIPFLGWVDDILAGVLAVVAAVYGITSGSGPQRNRGGRPFRPRFIEEGSEREAV